MATAMVHRGPDDSGVWADPNNGVALGFRRLAIIDLSANGHQPMQSRTSRFTIVFNGEVYNHIEIAAELRSCGHSFRGHSDTEVILAAFEQWGIEAAVSRFVGMFAIAVWDSDARVLRLIRDRMGIKPLFVFQRRGIIAFASELKALTVLPEFDNEIDHDGLAAYFRHLYIPAPRTIYRRVTKLLPGHILTVEDPAADHPEPTPYWSALRTAAVAPRFDGSDEDAVDLLDRTLTDAVRLRMRADVPVGAFLSGGVDSSTVVALMQEVSPRPVQTFTIGFDSHQHDEAAEAAAVARHIGTDHTELRLSGTDALDLIPRLPDMFDEPLADPSQLPTYLICSAARKHVTVAVSGDGGDELFAGYNRYAYGSQVIPHSSRIPRSLRTMVAAGITSVAPEMWDRVHTTATTLLHRTPQRLGGEKAHKFAHLLRERSSADMYESLMSAWRSSPVFQGSARHPAIERAMSATLPLSLLQRMMLADQEGYLADDLLAKVDRASMAVSLEVRVPVLDHRVVELSWRFPDHLKLRDGRGKWVLRQVLERRVPSALIDRPKVGFTVPLAEWLRGPLRSWAEEKLQPVRLARGDLLDVAAIRRTWEGFLARKNSEHLALWTVLMFESWRDRWLH